MNRIDVVRATFVLTLALALGACGADEPEELPVEDTPPVSTTPAQPDQQAVDGALLDPGTASREQLMAVPGMDAATADAVIAGRPYQTMLEVDAVLAGSLDEAAREELYRHMFKPLDLNTASSEEIHLIPGVGDRMTHEFEEYRPYDAIARFRREMAKYVDDAEVARLERYVTIR